MLRFLSIKNYALIDSLEIDFHKGFSTITGETGSGKSIIIGALSLILGKRSDISVLKNQKSKCIVEANFDIEPKILKDFFEENEIDYEKTTIVRREIAPNGKTRSFINDTPVQLSLLKDFSSMIIDIHSQHQNLELNNNLFQIKVVDLFAKNEDIINKYFVKYTDFKQFNRQYVKLLEKAESSKVDLDYFQFQYEQLEKLNLIEGEQENIERNLMTLNNAEEIKSKLFALSQNFIYQDKNLINQISSVKTEISKLVDVYPKAKEIADRLESIIIELQDIAEETEQESEKINYNPQEIEKLTDRLSAIFELQQKHRVNTIEELIKIKDELNSKISTIVNYDDKLKNQKLQLDIKEKTVNKLASEIHDKRKKVIPNLENKVNILLKNLGMLHAVFKVELTENQTLSEHGRSDINFLFSANKKVAPADITKIASGGELSRLMLALKYTIFSSSFISTIIFDEIDLGVSGEIADKMGILMSEMSENIQVISITHLPQIASRGKQHYRVLKDEKQKDANISIELLKSDDRIIEIAKMLSAENLTDAAIENAKMLLRN